MELKKNTLFVWLIAITSMLVLTTCKKDNYIRYDYELTLPCAEEERLLVLDKMTAPIATITCSDTWLSVTICEELYDGHPAIAVISHFEPNDKVVEATIKVKSENNEEANVLVRQGIHLLGDALLGENMDFITDWENCHTVIINGEPEPVATPWESDNQSNIPYAIRKQCKKADGWEMAFCSLNNTATPKICFFALYNKWSGTLRVFHYIKDPRGYGNEIIYRVWMGLETSTNNAPYYHSMEYGVPANHSMNSSLEPHANFVGSAEQTQSFMTWVTPYLLFTNSLVSGWYCFDVDMTGYVPSGIPWRSVNDDVKMIIVPQISNSEAITLRGTLVGDIHGQFDNPEVIQHGGGNCMSGICGILNMIKNSATSNITTSNAYASAMKTATGISEYLTPLKYYGGFAASIASGLLGFIGDQMAEPVTYDSIPGKIDMKLDAQLDLSGAINSYTSTDQAIFNVTLDNINASNGQSGQMGRGIWSLAEDPVVYIDKDDLISDYDHFTILDNGEDYSSSDFANYGVRMMWFFDPTSVKVNINRDLFPDVENVKVTTTCGIYTGREAGNSDEYRRFLMLPERPTFSLNNGTSSVVRLSATSTPALHVASRESLLVTGYTELETADNSEEVQQAGNNQIFYGHEADACNKAVMVDPQVYLGYAGSKVEKPKAPEFVVTVNVVFESNGNTLLYSKCFIPRIEIIDRATTLQKRAQLIEYKNNSQNGIATGFLANDHSVPVYSPDGDRLIARTLVRLGLIEE